MGDAQFVPGVLGLGRMKAVGRADMQSAPTLQEALALGCGSPSARKRYATGLAVTSRRLATAGGCGLRPSGDGSSDDIFLNYTHRWELKRLKKY